MDTLRLTRLALAAKGAGAIRLAGAATGIGDICLWPEKNEFSTVNRVEAKRSRLVSRPSGVGPDEANEEDGGGDGSCIRGQRNAEKLQRRYLPSSLCLRLV